MNKLSHMLLLSFWGLVVSASAAMAFDVPSYIKDPQNVSENMCIILRENTAKRKGVTTAGDLSDKLNETINEYAARLYAEALSTRANMSVEKKKNSADERATDKQQILQKRVKKRVKRVAKLVKQIMELEAAIAHLQGTQILATMDNVRCEDAEDEQ